jgi:anti-sigma-K factor RskA
MTDDRRPEEEDALLAAQFALGLLDGDDLARATALVAADPAFRREAGRWSGRFAPMLDEVEAATPPPGLWGSIERRLDSPREIPPVVLLLRRRLAIWRGSAAAATAIAAWLALVLLTRAPPPPPPSQPSVMVATMSAEGSPARLVATWEPGSRSLVVAAAAPIATAPGRGHELWLIPADGKPRPLGMLRPAAMRMRVPTTLDLGEGMTLALSVEPAAGSPTGLPTGPVIAAGKLAPV